MKHNYLKHLFTALLLLCTTVASAHDFVKDGICYNILSEEDKTVEVTYQGSYWNTVTNDYSGHVTIPETVTYGGTTYTVVAIGESAFAGCEHVTGVTIPSTIKSIGTAGFGVNEAETDFTSVYISDLAAWCNIDFASIASNPLSHAEYFYLNGELITNIVIPDGIEEIKNFAFYGYGDVDITIPNSVKKIGQQAFSVYFNNVYISDLAAWCNIDFKSNPLSNADNLYLNGELVTALVIPDGVEEIKTLAFNGCSFVESLSIPQSVTSIANDAFQNCTNLVNITVAESNTIYDSRENCNAIIETGTNRVYFGCKNSTIPNGVEIIGNKSFAGSGISNIEIPNSVTVIEDYAFKGCTNIKSIIIPNNIISVGGSAFSSCSSLESVVISNSVKTIETYTFYNCTKLKNVTIPEGVTSIGERSFESCNALTFITIPSSVTKINNSAFYNCSNLKLVYNNSALNIGFNTNNGYVGSYANSIILPSDDIQGDYIFRTTNGTNYLIAYTGNDTDLILPESYNGKSYVINQRVFRENRNIKSVVISDSVTSIGEYAFKSCSYLEKVTIGKNVTQIEDYAFSNCSRLTNVINNSSLNITAGASTHGNIAYNAKVVILGTDDIQGDFVFRTTNGVHSLVAYLGNEFDLILPENYNGNNYTIGSNVFKNKTISSITIPESVTSIGNDAFYGCNIRTVYNNSDLNITVASTANGYVAYYARVVVVKGDNIQGDYIFRIIDNNPTLVGYLGNETDIELPQNYYGGVYSIGEYVFRNNTTIKSISISDGITSIGRYAFYNCTGLTSITIPQSITSIGDYAFQNCSNLISVLNFSNLVLTKKNTGNGYVAYYAERVINAPSGSVEGDYIFGVIDGVNTLIACTAVTSNNFDDWTSTNHSKNSSSSNTYLFEAKAGDILTFDWCVSSEDDYDEFTITLDGTILVDVSGERSGNYKYVFTSDGTYKLLARYRKDDSTSEGKDCGTISNIYFSGAKLDNYVDIVLPENYKGEDYVIGSEVFKKCNIGSIVIPESVTRIGDNAFNGSTGLISVTSNAKIAPELGLDVFVSISPDATLYYPYFGDYSAWEPYFSSVQAITPTIVITINQYGSATYCSEYALDFSEVEGLKAYAATGYNKVTQVITLTRLQTAEAGVGLFLKGEPGEYVVPVIEYSNDYSLNLLVGTLEQTIVNSTEGEMSNYKFTVAELDEAPMFYPFEDNTTFSAGKAYLQIPTAWLPATAQKSLSVRFDDGETTDIDELKGENGEVKTIYDLQGRVVENPTSGIYIINGKKVVIK